MNIHIKNGRLIDPARNIDTQSDIYIANGKIAGLSLAPSSAPVGFQADTEINAAGLIVCPGLVDLAARLHEPSYAHKSALESELQAAVAGGISSLACPPDTHPPLDEPDLVEMLKYRAQSLSLARVYPIGALTLQLAGERLSDMVALCDAGCVAFSQANTPIVNTQILLRAFQYAATFGLTVWMQATDAYLSRGGVAHEGEVATRLGLKGIPVCAETIALSTLLQLARHTGVSLHITRLSSAEGVAMIRDAKAQGMAVSCDVSAHHLHLSDMDIGYFNAHAHLQPPLRAQKDREALQQGLADGTIDALCSNHTPVNDDAKQRPFSEAEPGATGLELLLPLTLKWAAAMKLPLSSALARVTCNAARILGLEAGNIAAGAAADICIFDPHAAWVVNRDTLKSQGKNTPFLGCEMIGKVRYTLVEGRVVYTH